MQKTMTSVELIRWLRKRMTTTATMTTSQIAERRSSGRPAGDGDRPAPAWRPYGERHACWRAPARPLEGFPFGAYPGAGGYPGGAGYPGGG